MPVFLLLAADTAQNPCCEVAVTHFDKLLTELRHIHITQRNTHRQLIVCFPLPAGLSRYQRFRFGSPPNSVIARLLAHTVQRLSVTGELLPDNCYPLVLLHGLTSPAAGSSPLRRWFPFRGLRPRLPAATPFYSSSCTSFCGSSGRNAHHWTSIAVST